MLSIDIEAVGRDVRGSHSGFDFRVLPADGSIE